ncbi:hypothetical protein Q5P01_024513 [Channa striata]|uniref:Uncharacterized protein n=1 Tax=Channa striata TaxID=64152 RepID=A0AA88LN17_CHASR|nr:hypothetical protein Q5P01_024513 [Channa striata]
MTLRKVFSVNEWLSHLFDLESDIEENVSETEDDVKEDPDYEASSSHENETLSVDPLVANTLPSKNGKLLWSISPLERQGRLSAANVIKMVPGPTRYAVSHQWANLAHDEKVHDDESR